MRARCSTVIDRPAARVFGVLLDPYAYSKWVVGTKRIRGVDTNWPAEDASFYHEVGAGPLRIKDRTTLVSKEQNVMIWLRARVWPAGEADVRLILEADGDRTRITMEEEPCAGPARALWNPMLAPVLHVRNLASLARLKRLVEND